MQKSIGVNATEKLVVTKGANDAPCTRVLGGVAQWFMVFGGISTLDTLTKGMCWRCPFQMTFARGVLSLNIRNAFLTGRKPGTIHSIKMRNKRIFANEDAVGKCAAVLSLLFAGH